MRVWEQGEPLVFDPELRPKGGLMGVSLGADLSALAALLDGQHKDSQALRLYRRALVILENRSAPITAMSPSR